MINIEFNTNGFIAKGHALFAPKGQDIVCAGVTAVIVGALNVFNEHEVKVEIKEGFCSLHIYVHSEEHNLILKVINTQLKTIEEAYPQHLKIQGGN